MSKFLQFLLVALLFLNGCQSTSVEQDPQGKRLPLGTISTLNATFEPEILPYLRTVSIWRFDSIPDIVGIGAAGAYIPFTKIILLADNASRPNDTLVHEMLHVICFKEKFPYPELLKEDIDRFLQDPAYRDLARAVKRTLESYESSRRFPRSFLPDEYYCYIGEYLYGQRKGGHLGLPDYMARHYRGILNPLLLFDDRYYKDKAAPKFDDLIAEISLAGNKYTIKCRMDHLQALVRYGGVLKARESETDSTRTIRSVGLADTPLDGEVLIPPGVIPANVSIQIWLPMSRFKYHPTIQFVSCELWVNDEYSFSLGRTTRDLVVANSAWFRISWQESQTLLNHYLQKRMVIRLNP